MLLEASCAHESPVNLAEDSDSKGPGPDLKFSIPHKLLGCPSCWTTKHTEK